MRRQRVIVVAFGAAVLAALVAAIVLVLGGSPTVPVEPTPAADPAAERPPVDESEGHARRRAGHQGEAAIVGRVVRGEKATPAEGVTLRLDRESLPGWTVASDDTGRFRFESLPHGGPFLLSATAEDCAPIRLPGLVLERREELDVGDLRLDRAVSVTVEVRGPGDVPLADATVEAFAQAEVRWTVDWTKRLSQIGVEPTPVAEQHTDAEGRVRLTELAAGTWALRASAPGYARGGRIGVRLLPEDDAGREPVVLRLRAGHELSGRVLDGDGDPIEGALLLGMRPDRAWSPETAPLHARTTSDEEGRYRLSELPAGELSVWAAVPEGVPAQVAVLRVPDITRFDVRLRLAGLLQGRVTEVESGAPVVGVEVRASGWGTDGSQRIGVGLTDDDGRYRIDRMPAGLVNQVTVDRPGWLVVHERGTPWQQIAVPAGAVATHDIVMREGAVASGVVRGPDGPVAGAAVTVQATAASGWSTFAGKTDPSGRYRIAGLPEGKGMLRVEAEGFVQPGLPEPWWDALNNGTIPPEWLLEIPAAGEVVLDARLIVGGIVTGVVEDAEGAPLAGAEVMALGTSSSSRAESDENGAFRLEGLPFGTPLTVHVSAKRHVAESTEVAAVTEASPRAEVQVALRARPLLRGRVTADGSAPPAGTEVRLAPPHGYDRSNPWSWQDPERLWDVVEPVVVRPDGTFEIDLPFDSGKVIVRASAPGFAPTESDALELTQGRLEYDVELELGGGVPLVGRVVDATTGEPLPGALVAVGTRHPEARRQPWLTQNVHPPLRAVTDEDGQFRVVWPQAGVLDLRVQHDGHVAAKRAPTVPQEEPLEIRLSRALTIEGVVRFADGSPAGGVQIAVESESGQRRAATESIVSSDDGTFRIDGLVAGKYVLKAQPPWNGDANVKTTEVRGVAAGSRGVEIIVEVGLTIAGTVLGPDGEGVGNVHVNAQNTTPGVEGGWASAATRPDGTFEIVGLDPGPHTLFVGGRRDTRSAQIEGVAAGTTGVTLRLEAGLEIQGRVVDEQGDPVPNLTVQALPPDAEIEEFGYTSVLAQTDAEGAFVLQGLAPGIHRIVRANPSSEDASTRDHVLVGGDRVAAGANEVRLVLSKGAVIRGVVTDGSGAPVRGATMLWVRARIAGTSTEKWVSVDAEGAFEITGLSEEHEYEVRTMGGGFRPASAGPFPGDTSGVRLVVEQGLACTGRLQYRDGTPIAGTNVVFRHLETDDRAWGTTDDDGRFEVSGLIEATYRVTAGVPERDAGGRPTTRQVTVELGVVEAGARDVLLEVPETE